MQINVLCLIMLLLSLIPAVPPVSAAGEPAVELVVAKGDYLIKIGKTYLEDPHTWREIARLNHLSNPDFIKPGQKLLVPVRLLRGIPADGTVTFVKGDVTLKTKDGAEWQAIRLNDPVREGNKIKTADDSAAEITFADGSTFLMRPQTEFKISVARKKSAANMVHAFFLEWGNVIARIKHATGVDTRHEIKAPSAVAVVRGTEFRFSSDTDETTRTEVLDGLVGVEAMKHKVAVAAGEGTVVRKGEPPMTPRKLLTPPVPVKPLPFYKSKPFRFAFERFDGAASYRVALSRDSEFKDILKEIVIGPGETVEFSGIDDGAYYLRSISIDDAGLEGMPMEPLAITIRTHPQPPIIQSPVDGSEHRERAVACEWLKVSDAAGYHLQISEDEAFSTLAVDRKDIRDARFTTKALEFKTYFFRVSSVAADGFEGEWSDSLKFTIVPPPPAPPMDKPSLDDKEIHLRWRDLGAGFSYHFQLAKDADFKNIITDTRVDRPEISLPRPGEAGTYFTRVSGIDAKGYEGGFSAPQSFEIEKRVPWAILGIIGLILILAL